MPPPSLRGKGTFLIPLSVVCPLPSGFPLIYPTEIAAEKANASWQDSVYYNGVNYEKGTDAEGKEYYYVYYKENESAVPEKTINTLPVKERE